MHTLITLRQVLWSPYPFPAAWLWASASITVLLWLVGRRIGHSHKP